MLSPPPQPVLGQLQAPRGLRLRDVVRGDLAVAVGVQELKGRLGGPSPRARAGGSWWARFVVGSVQWVEMEDVSIYPTRWNWSGFWEC